MENSEKVFDPSGHLTINLVVQAGYLSSYLFLEKLDITNGCIKRDDCFHRESGVKLLKHFCLVIFILFQAHACYSLIFAAFIFHTIGEAVMGWFFGMAISGFVYESRCLANILDEAAEWKWFL